MSRSNGRFSGLGSDHVPGAWTARLQKGAALVLAGASLVACSKPSSETIAKRSERLVITDGLVAAYDFDEGSGTSAPDISGNGNTGTLSGPTWNASGRRGSALSFDGVDDRVLVPDSTSLISRAA